MERVKNQPGSLKMSKISKLKINFFQNLDLHHSINAPPGFYGEFLKKFVNLTK